MVAVDITIFGLLDYGILGLAIVALIWIGVTLWRKYEEAMALYIEEKELRRVEAVENVKAYESLCVELRTVLDTLCRTRGEE